MKKLLCMVLSLCLMLGLVSFATAEAAPYKIAILTGTTSQGEEEYRAMETLKNQYPDIVISDTYPDNFAAEIETTKSKLVNFAFDPDVKAIIMCQAVPGCSPGFDEVREMRPDILLIAAVPQEAAATISAAADIVLYSDEPAQGNQIVDTIAKWGAEVFIHYSFPRHMAIETIVARRALMIPLCEEKGIEFVDRTAPDPTGEAGMPGAQQFILDDVPAVMEEFAGKKVAFYTTNCGMQEPLQAAVLVQPNAYYPLPCCPSPYHGFPTSFDISTTEEMKNDPEAMLAAIAEVLKEKDALGRFSTWAVPVNMSFIYAGFEYATRYINGEFTDVNDADAAYQAMLVGAGVDELEFTTYTDVEGVNYPNYYLAMLPAVDFNDYVE